MPTVAAELRNNPRVKYEIEKIKKMIAVIALVENSGFCFPRVVGIKEIIKIQLPAVGTQSCQCIFEKITLTVPLIQRELFWKAREELVFHLRQLPASCRC